jgi:hypothetical protein
MFDVLLDFFTMLSSSNSYQPPMLIVKMRWLLVMTTAYALTLMMATLWMKRRTGDACALE